VLSRSLGPAQLIAAGIGCMVGGGIFLTTSALARQYGAPSLLAGYLVAAVACALTALCYAEFASLEPGAGSAYQYALAALGRFPAWLIGGALFLEYSFGSAAVAVLWTGSPRLAAAVALLATLLLVLGIRISSRVNAALVLLKCGTLLLFTGWVGLWAARAPAVAAIAGPAGDWLTVAGLAIFSYLGFEAVSTLGLESRNPQRDLPIGVIGSLAITTALYLAVIAAYGVVPAPQGDGLLGAALATGAGALGKLIHLCVYAGLSTVLLMMMMGQSRIFYAMACDGLLPAQLLRTQPKTHAPVAAIAATGALVALLCVLVPAQKLYDIAVAGTLFAFTAVAVAVPILRLRAPHRPRPFRVPVVWVTAPAAVGVNVVLLSKLVPGIAVEIAICAAVSCLGWLFVRKGFTVEAEALHGSSPPSTPRSG
jgi:APA family basic amino acid/polyamine antiporter